MRADCYVQSRRPKKYASVRIDGDSDCVCLKQDAAIHRLCGAKRHSMYKRQQVSGMRLLFRAPVVRVEKFEAVWAHPFGPFLLIEENPLTDDEADLFAWRDGFRHPMSATHRTGYGSFHLMMEFWQKSHDLKNKRFHGQLIHWDYANRFSGRRRRLECSVSCMKHPRTPEEWQVHARGEGVLRPRSFWFRMRRATRGRLPNGPWVYYQVFETSKRRAWQQARAVLSRAIGHEIHGFLFPWGGPMDHEHMEPSRLPSLQIMQTSVLMKHLAGLVYMEKL